MGFFRKRAIETVAALDTTSPLEAVVAHVEPLADEARQFSAGDLFPLVAKAASTYGSDARIYLIIANDVGRNGRASAWEFHVLFPTLKAEGLWMSELSEDGTRSVLSSRLSPVPAPGTTEYLMAQISPQMSAQVSDAWNLRVEMIAPLPATFVDTPEVVAAIERLQPNVFATGPIRLKARTLPQGESVWEWKGSDLVHVPFALTPDQHNSNQPSEIGEEAVLESAT